MRQDYFPDYYYALTISTTQQSVDYVDYRHASKDSFVSSLDVFATCLESFVYRI
jgi:hypothetical protein